VGIAVFRWKRIQLAEAKQRKNHPWHLAVYYLMILATSFYMEDLSMQNHEIHHVRQNVWGMRPQPLTA
jgi:hypothetical protein